MGRGTAQKSVTPKHEEEEESCSYNFLLFPRRFLQCQRLLGCYGKKKDGDGDQRKKKEGGEQSVSALHRPLCAAPPFLVNLQGSSAGAGVRERERMPPVRVGDGVSVRVILGKGEPELVEAPPRPAPPLPGAVPPSLGRGWLRNNGPNICTEHTEREDGMVDKKMIIVREITLGNEATIKNNSWYIR
eukprot:gene6672-4781_t